MSIPFDDTLLAHAFVPLPGCSDWMAAVHQVGPSRFTLTHRVRYADPLRPGADPWEDIDRKSWQVAQIADVSPADVIQRLQSIAQLMAAAAGSEVSLTVRQEGESTERLLERFRGSPVVNMKVNPAGDAG